MRIAVFHNRYLERGGEDVAVEREVEWLRKAGCQVWLFSVGNAELRGRVARARAALSARGSRAMVQRVERFLARHPVDLGHVHNFFPLLTPSVHAALARRGLPVVQTLHNYRLACAQGAFLRRERACEDCLGRGPWNAVRHGCWRGSRLATAVWADAIAHHRRRQTWERCVDRFVAPSAFAQRKLAEAGLDAARSVVIADPVPDPGPPAPPGRGGVYVGRLAPEKGVRLLLEAWRALAGTPLTLVGDGPQRAELERQAADLPQVRFTGWLPADRVRAELARAAFAVAPSLCYETFGLAAAEALAAGRPLVAAHPGALAELVEPGRNGLRFASGDARSLAEACRALASDPQRAAAMGGEARLLFEERLAPDVRTDRLLALYRELVR